jgi:hypothetical protein
MHYDPNQPVDPTWWLDLDEAEQQHAVEQFHKRAHVHLPSRRVHAIIHAAIETQLAEQHAAAGRALDRMLVEGLDRHDAIHAVGSVMARHIFDILKHGQSFNEEAYAKDLDALSAEQWRAESEGE